MSAPPDPEFVRGCLEVIGRSAGYSPDPEFVEVVVARMDAGGRENGNGYRALSLERLIIETADEAADVAGWVVLILDRLTQPDVEDELAELAGELQMIAAEGHRLWRRLERVRQTLED